MTENPKPLAGQTALVTGAARRIGRSIALALAEAGADVAVHYNRSKQEALETTALVTNLGSRALAFQHDLTDIGGLGKLVARVEEKLAPVDILVNNAAIFEKIPWDRVTEADWDRFQTTNLKAQFFLAQAVARGMKARGRGVILNLASLGGLKVWPSFIPYSVSKAGLIHLTRLLARALGPEIRVNAIAPGRIEFDGDEHEEKFARRAPVGRVGTGGDIAATAVFLCTSADFITGQIFVVDGGESLV